MYGADAGNEDGPMDARDIRLAERFGFPDLDSLARELEQFAQLVIRGEGQRTREGEDDLVQDIFVEVFRSVLPEGSSYVGPSVTSSDTEKRDAFRAYVRTIILRMLRHRLREQGREHERLAEYARSHQPALETASPLQLTLEAPDARDWEALVFGLSQLSESDRELVELVRLRGLSYLEVAELLDVPPTTLYPRMNRALARIREHAARFLATHRPAGDIGPDGAKAGSL
jgi:RNA polymerase sigma factor (sigma-70 family)